MSRNRSWQTSIDAHRLIYRSDAVFDTFHALWRAILRSNSRSRRTLIHAQRATACILCLKSPRYLVLLFLVWKKYWKMVASTLLRFFLLSKGMDSTSPLVFAFSIWSHPKYLQFFLPSLFSTWISSCPHDSQQTGDGLSPRRFWRSLHGRTCCAKQKGCHIADSHGCTSGQTVNRTSRTAYLFYFS